MNKQLTPLAEPYRRLWSKEEYYRLGECGFFQGQKVELVDGDIIVPYPDPEKSGLPYRTGSPQSRLWTKAEYYRLGELGFFRGQKVELLEGTIVVASPQNWSHYSGLDRVAEVLRNALGAGVWVRTQAPLNLGLMTEPEPDVSVVAGRRADYRDHPTTALLIVEVSDTTLDYDRTTKASIYASAGIADYWVVNLVQDQVEIFRNPVADPSQPYGHRYADMTVHFSGMSINPLANPTVMIAVKDLLG
ncbi:MAG TPA: Uma2 family endonuclease [Gemmataceae bacterium]|nr:Uma2 family endonuclease [Gemmataceae bacterium]